MVQAVPQYDLANNLCVLCGEFRSLSSRNLCIGLRYAHNAFVPSGNLGPNPAIYRMDGFGHYIFSFRQVQNSFLYGLGAFLWCNAANACIDNQNWPTIYFDWDADLLNGVNVGFARRILTICAGLAEHQRAKNQYHHECCFQSHEVEAPRWSIFQKALIGPDTTPRMQLSMDSYTV